MDENPPQNEFVVVFFNETYITYKSLDGLLKKMKSSNESSNLQTM